MIPYADSSFVIALFTQDDHSDKAWSWWLEREEVTLLFSRLTKLEFAAVLHQLKCGGEIAPSGFRSATRSFEAAVSEGLLILRQTRSAQLFPAAHRLIDHYSEGFACKAMDVLHVAAAALLRADTFLTFDAHQSRLARSTGLMVPDGFVKG